MQPGSRRNVGATRSAHGAFDRYIFSGAPMDNNVYLLVCPRTRDAVLIDASGDADQVLKEVRQAQARVRMILMTHGHADHWGALGRLRDALGASVGIHLADADMLPLTPNFALSDGQRIAFGAASLDVLHTPGHTPGSVCFLSDGQLFSGDTLFPDGPGATKPPLATSRSSCKSPRPALYAAR